MSRAVKAQEANGTSLTGTSLTGTSLTGTSLTGTADQSNEGRLFPAWMIHKFVRFRRVLRRRR